MDTRTATATIDAAQVAQYQADGFLVGRDAFGSDRIAELEAEADRLRSRLDLIDPNNLRCRW